MPTRHLPVRPDLAQLKRQAKELHRAVREGDAAALAEFTAHHPAAPPPDAATLADAQLALARAYGAPSWPRLAHACELVHAIWANDVEAVRRLVTRDPALLHQDTLLRDSNWGPPLSYAANLGRMRIIRMLHRLGATDLEHALDRATLQGQVPTAAMIHALLGAPAPPEGALAGPAYTLSVEGTEFALRVGARAVDDAGRRLAPVDVVLETDGRNPGAKHRILALYVQHGVVLPDTPTMALHQGRIDLLEAHLRRDTGLLSRTFRHEEIYPPELGCHDERLATHGTPLDGTTLLHLCADYGELEIARWLLERGAPVDTPARVDANGFGGHTALFGTVVSQPNFWMNHDGGPQEAPFTELLLRHGAEPNARASLRKQLHPGYDDPRVTECRDVTPLGWGRGFHAPVFVSQPAMELIRNAGGT